MKQLLKKNYIHLFMCSKSVYVISFLYNDIYLKKMSVINNNYYFVIFFLRL